MCKIYGHDDCAVIPDGVFVRFPRVSFTDVSRFCRHVFLEPKADLISVRSCPDVSGGRRDQNNSSHRIFPTFFLSPKFSGFDFVTVQKVKPPVFHSLLRRLVAEMLSNEW